MTRANTLLSLFCLVALAACTSQPTTAPLPDRTRLEAEAQAAADAGQTAAAAALYRRLADASRGSERSAYLLTGARLLIDRSDWLQARTWIDEAAANGTLEQQREAVVLNARVDVGLMRPELALQSLAQLAPQLPVDLSSDAAEVRGRALFALGRYAEAVRELVDREIWLDTADAILANQQLIWDGLAEGAAAVAAAPRTGDPIVDGWLDLAPLTRLSNDPGAFRVALIEWRRQFSNHPAAGGILAQMLAEQRLGGTRPSRIALLLPLGSTRRTQALAVRDGFMAAHLASGGSADTSIRIYDTALRGAGEAYLQAQLEGADFIVGPLLPNEVQLVAGQAGFVPTLALNFTPAATVQAPSLFQFALAPEDEIEAIAARAIAAGQTTALALFASNDRGYRLMDDFREAYEALGGQVLNSAAYVPESQNFTDPITSLLNIQRSEQRHRRLQANLGRPVAFEPRRRQDVDMIFIQADLPQLGRLLAPQLRFHDAGDIPTYATSAVFDPAREASDSDLNGVIFPDLPLLLEPDANASALTGELRQYWPQRARQWIRFYAFGFDAYQLVERIYNPDPLSWPMAGVTGDLSMDASGRIHRLLPFAQFQSGRPVAMAPLVPAIEESPAGLPRVEPGFVGAR